MSDSSIYWQPVGCKRALLEQETAQRNKNVSALSSLSFQESRLEADLLLCWSCRLRGPEEGPGGAGSGLATSRPQTGLAGWASSMERLIPTRTKRPPVVQLKQQQQSFCSKPSLYLQLQDKTAADITA